MIEDCDIIATAYIAATELVAEDELSNRIYAILDSLYRDICMTEPHLLNRIRKAELAARVVQKLLPRSRES